MDIGVDYQVIIDELLERNKILTLENIVLTKAFERLQNPPQDPSAEAD
jgi:hypothetical protein